MTGNELLSCEFFKFYCELIVLFYDTILLGCSKISHIWDYCNYLEKNIDKKNLLFEQNIYLKYLYYLYYLLDNRLILSLSNFFFKFLTNIPDYLTYIKSCINSFLLFLDLSFLLKYDIIKNLYSFIDDNFFKWKNYNFWKKFLCTYICSIMCYFYILPILFNLIIFFCKHLIIIIKLKWLSNIFINYLNNKKNKLFNWIKVNLLTKKKRDPYDGEFKFFMTNDEYTYREYYKIKRVNIFYRILDFIIYEIVIVALIDFLKKKNLIWLYSFYLWLYSYFKINGRLDFFLNTPIYLFFLIKLYIFIIFFSIFLIFIFDIYIIYMYWRKNINISEENLDKSAEIYINCFRFYKYNFYLWFFTIFFTIFFYNFSNYIIFMEHIFAQVMRPSDSKIMLTNKTITPYFFIFGFTSMQAFFIFLFFWFILMCFLLLLLNEYFFFLSIYSEKIKEIKKIKNLKK